MPDGDLCALEFPEEASDVRSWLDAWLYAYIHLFVSVLFLHLCALEGSVVLSVLFLHMFGWWLTPLFFPPLFATPPLFQQVQLNTFAATKAAEGDNTWKVGNPSTHLSLHTHIPNFPHHGIPNQPPCTD